MALKPAEEFGTEPVVGDVVVDTRRAQKYEMTTRLQECKKPLYAIAYKGVVRVVDCERETLQRSFVGHGGSVNELRTQSLMPCLVASASKDESVRLWNVETGVCVLVFAGARLP
jgi:WD40 repeat protein